MSRKKNQSSQDSDPFEVLRSSHQLNKDNPLNFSNIETSNKKSKSTPKRFKRKSLSEENDKENQLNSIKKTPDTNKKAKLMPSLEKESEKWKKLDEFKLEEEIIEEEESVLPPIKQTTNTPIKKSERKTTSPLIKSKSNLKEIMFDDFLQDELGVDEIKKIKKEYLKDHLKHLPKEEGNRLIEKLKNEYQNYKKKAKPIDQS